MRDALSGDILTPAADDPAAWPTRACCCPAPPAVRVSLPVPYGSGAVELFLCGHHYRASLGPLALADARVAFRGRPEALALVRPGRSGAPADV